MTRSRKGVTAAEFKAELERDPVWVEQRRQREEAFKRLEEEYARAEAPLVRELHAAGLTVGSAWDLVNTTTAYRQALPILLDHLHREYPDAIREGIARALAVPEAKFAWPVLVKLYREEEGPRTKDGLAVAICNIADDTTRMRAHHQDVVAQINRFVDIMGDEQDGTGPLRPKVQYGVFQ